MSLNRKRLLAVIACVQVVLAVLAWRDLAKRPNHLVRGKKRLWRAATLLNPGNSIFYWLFGRR
jgi:hypothetical protein